MSEQAGRAAGRLLSVNNYHYRRGGAEAVYLAQNALFEQAGWEVVPFAMRHPDNLPSAWSGYFVEEIEFGQAYGPLDRLRRALKAVYSREARARLRALIERVRPDIVHAHNVYHHLSPAIFPVVKAAGLPLVLTLHDLKLACPAYTMLSRGAVCERCRGGRYRHVLARRCMKGSVALSALVYAEATLHERLGSYRRHVDRFVVPSRFYRDKLVEWGWPAERFVHIPNCLDTRPYHPCPEPGREVLYFGRLAPEKGLHTLVAAAARTGHPLCLVGEGPQRAALQRQAEASGARVRFTGRLSGAALRREVAAARAVVLPSEWYENAPLSVLEAYALGKPVLGAAIGGIPELVREGQTGWTFAPGRVDDLAEALGRLYGCADSRLASMGRAARHWVQSCFTPAAQLERLRGLYAELGAP